jgi:hypothetical protein
MATMPVIARYDSIASATSPLDPIEDVTCWVAGLNSAGYTSDVLSQIHGITSPSAVRQAAHAIAAFSRSAIGLLEQAYSGPPEVSFLPLYYAILNLSKVSIVAQGSLPSLGANRWHGASYNPLAKVSHDLLNEVVVIKPKGVLPLLFTAITGCQPPKSDRTIRMRDIYPYLRSVGYEYRHAYGEETALQFLSLTVIGDAANGFRVLARTAEVARAEAGNLRYLKAITGFRATASPDQFHSESVSAPDPDSARQRLLPKIRRFLLYETITNAVGQPTGALTPLSNRQFLLPEEIPIWIAFFHLANIVRYNAEFMERLRDTKVWPVLLNMRKHCVLRYPLLSWSALHKKEFVLVGK